MIYAGILAAGIGVRMHRQDLPKQFLPLGKKPILINTLEQFYINSNIEKIIIVAPDEWKQFTEDMIGKYDNMGTDIKVISGGINKIMSVHMIVEEIKKSTGIYESDILITHDAVRPFVTQRIINENISIAKEYGSAGTTNITNDTIVISEDGVTISEIPPKRKMYSEQTPLTFNLNLLDEIFKYADQNGIKLESETELARLYINKGYYIHMVRGDNSNMKIITPYDLEVANALLVERKL